MDEDWTNIHVSRWDRDWGLGIDESVIHAIGQVSCSYTAVENAIFEVFSASLGSDPVTAAALCKNAGLQVGNTPNFIKKRLAEKAEWSTGLRQSAQFLFEDFRKLREVRTNVIHLTPSPGGGTTTPFYNWRSARGGTDSHISTYTLEQLRQASSDLMVLWVHLVELSQAMRLAPEVVAALVSKGLNDEGLKAYPRLSVMLDLLAGMPSRQSARSGRHGA